MKIQVSLIVGWLVLACSYSPKVMAVEERRQSAIHEVGLHLGQNGASSDDTRPQLDRALLDALNSANADSLRKPVEVSAVLHQLIHFPRGFPITPCGLFVVWIEDQPSVIALELKYRNNPSMVFPMTPPDMNGNLMSARRTVVFSAHQSWTSISDFEKTMGWVSGTNDLQVRLLRGGTPETDWAPVHVQVIDHNEEKQADVNQSDIGRVLCCIWHADKLSAPELPLARERIRVCGGSAG